MKECQSKIRKSMSDKDKEEQKRPSKDDYFISGEEYLAMLDELTGIVSKGN